jgi:hypothetical protein
MHPIVGEADPVLNLVRHFVYANGDPYAVQEIENPVIKVGNRLRFEREHPLRAPAGADDEAVTMKSNSISKISFLIGIGDVPSPRAVT